MSFYNDICCCSFLLWDKQWCCSFGLVVLSPPKPTLAGWWRAVMQPFFNEQTSFMVHDFIGFPCLVSVAGFMALETDWCSSGWAAIMVTETCNISAYRVGDIRRSTSTCSCYLFIFGWLRMSTLSPTLCNQWSCFDGSIDFFFLVSMVHQCWPDTLISGSFRHGSLVTEIDHEQYVDQLVFVAC